MSEVNILETGSKALYFLQKRWYIILLVTALGIGFAAYKQANVSAPVECFETKLLGETDSISNYLVVNLITTLSPSVDEKNTSYLMKELKVAEQTASTILELEAEIYLVDNDFDAINNNVVKVTLLVSNFSEMDNIRMALQNYVNEDPLFKGKGQLVFSPKYTISQTPTNVKGQISFVKYSVVFFALGLVLALALDFFFNILKYRKEGVK